MEVTDRIEVNPAICGGKPVIRGTRIMVRNILGMVAGGYAIDKILASYPDLTGEDVTAALEYAAQVGRGSGHRALILRIRLDQNIPPRVADFVRGRKPTWEVRHVNDVGLRGATDDAIFRWAEIDVRLRVWPTTVENTEAALARLLDSVAEEELRGSLVIVDQRRIRVRRSARHG